MFFPIPSLFTKVGIGIVSLGGLTSSGIMIKNKFSNSNSENKSFSKRKKKSEVEFLRIWGRRANDRACTKGENHSLCSFPETVDIKWEGKSMYVMRGDDKKEVEKSTLSFRRHPSSWTCGELTQNLKYKKFEIICSAF